MPRRRTVKINIECVEKLILSNGWSNVYFSTTLMGKGRGWITDWKRNGSLPSPEEAARMCLLLSTTPEEILTEPADIELVKDLIEAERAKHGIKKDLPQGEVDEKAQKVLNFLKTGAPEEVADVLKYIEFIESKRKK